jgi:hypothetical protein
MFVNVLVETFACLLDMSNKHTLSVMVYVYVWKSEKGCTQLFRLYVIGSCIYCFMSVVNCVAN